MVTALVLIGVVAVGITFWHCFVGVGLIVLILMMLGSSRNIR
jgi:hypothetical protein